MSGSDVIGVFAKLPRAGLVKTRLATATSPEFAARVAAAFLADTLAKVPSGYAERVLAFAPATAANDFAAMAPDWRLLPQCEGDLGERMRHFFASQFASQAERVVLIGTDSPTLPSDWLIQALQALRRADVVLGPATDGGYTLIGLRRMQPIFEGMTWSCSDVLARTVERLRANGATLSLLPPWYDVDTLDDWQTLAGHLRAMQWAGVDIPCPQTARLLDE